jgi:hypothetical protein
MAGAAIRLDATAAKAQVARRPAFRFKIIFVLPERFPAELGGAGPMPNYAPLGSMSKS